MAVERPPFLLHPHPLRSSDFIVISVRTRSSRTRPTTASHAGGPVSKRSITARVRGRTVGLHPSIRHPCRPYAACLRGGGRRLRLLVVARLDLARVTFAAAG